MQVCEKAERTRKNFRDIICNPKCEHSMEIASRYTNQSIEPTHII